MEIFAQTKYLRTSPRKLRLVARALKGHPVGKALVLLSKINKRAALPILKVLKSAAANAKNKGLSEANLKIKGVIVDGGPTYKRFQPISRGRAHPIAKRTSHIKVVLEEESGQAEGLGKIKGGVGGGEVPSKI
jgi:large subunit ribosomal protein L22